MKASGSAAKAARAAWITGLKGGQHTQSINQSNVLTKPHTGKETPHPSTTTEGSKPCVTK